MTSPDQSPQIDPVVVEVTFSEAARQQAFREDVGALPKDQQGFFGSQYIHDLRTGGIRKDDQGEPMRIAAPESTNPFKQ